MNQKDIEEINPYMDDQLSASYFLLKSKFNMYSYKSNARLFTSHRYNKFKVIARFPQSGAAIKANTLTCKYMYCIKGKRIINISSFNTPRDIVPKIVGGSINQSLTTNHFSLDYIQQHHYLQQRAISRHLGSHYLVKHA